METHEVAYGVPIVSVVRDGFCVPYPVELVIKKKDHGFFDTRFEVQDVNGNLFLQVDGFYRNFQKKRIMRDPAGFLILTMREKVLTSRNRWLVHQGESSERNDLLFSVQRSHPFQVKTRLDVSLASNINEDISNFQVVGCYSSQSCKVYKDDTLVAEVNHKFTWGSFLGGSDKFRVQVYPGVDYAFIVALVIIFSEIDM
ncbi:hypothetical protein P3X46_025790 [Hevea brasiliensis]|uniref:Uncharacterized protein n=1 Tax=Hevea brasiliensis TaxID=3981 RepID=A0ABQ9L9D3_HEVBR|nr:protein LURP-one-related 14-like [Hevea brasiliensis]KAJ9160383.1 hypothetical protein P3X46_025790 [Hevea brasiliensis]